MTQSRDRSGKPKIFRKRTRADDLARLYLALLRLRKRLSKAEARQTVH
jgi:hypothetical protein